MRDCAAAYLSADLTLRREWNQTFFERLEIDVFDGAGVSAAKLRPPFDTLLNAKVIPLYQRRAVDVATRRRKAPRVGSPVAPPMPVLVGAGSNKNLLVEVRGFEPLASSVRDLPLNYVDVIHHRKGRRRAWRIARQRRLPHPCLICHPAGCFQVRSGPSSGGVLPVCCPAARPEAAPEAPPKLAYGHRAVDLANGGHALSGRRQRLLTMSSMKRTGWGRAQLLGCQWWSPLG